MSLMIWASSWTKAIMQLVRGPIALLEMVFEHVLGTLFRVVISILISISRTIFFTKLTFVLISAPQTIIIAYVGFRIQKKSKK